MHQSVGLRTCKGTVGPCLSCLSGGRTLRLVCLFSPHFPSYLPATTLLPVSSPLALRSAQEFLSFSRSFLLPFLLLSFSASASDEEGTGGNERRLATGEEGKRIKEGKLC